MRRLWVIQAALLLFVGTLVAQEGPAAPEGVWAGVYTDAQAEQGAAVYRSSCVGCHGADLSGGAGPALAGEGFLAAWRGQPVTRLFRTIRDTMPRGNPGSLDDQTAVDVVAFIFRSNAFPTGDTELSAADDVLAALALVPEGAPAAVEVRDFSLVGVVGCLEGGGRQWSLSRALAPVPAAAASPTAEELAASARAEGDETFRLVSVLPFEPQAAQGRRVYVTGLIHRTPEATLLNVAGLEILDAECGG